MFWRREKSVVPVGILTPGNLTLSLFAVLTMLSTLPVCISVVCARFMPEREIY